MDEVRRHRRVCREANAMGRSGAFDVSFCHVERKSQLEYHRGEQYDAK